MSGIGYTRGLPADSGVVIGGTALERERTAAGKLAGCGPTAHDFQETAA